MIFWKLTIAVIYMFIAYYNDTIGSFTGDTTTTSSEYLMKKELNQINALLKLHKLSLGINKSNYVFNT